jgi:flagellar biosynthetic protein FliR
MQWLNDIAATYPLFQQILLIFVLVLSRISGLLMIAPVYGTREVPRRVRAFLAVALAMLITPTQLGVLVDEPDEVVAILIEPERDVEQPIDWNTDSGEPGNLINLLVFIGTEILVGMSLGLGITVLFVGVQLAGQIIAQMSGMAMANVLNPTLDVNIPLISQLLNMVTLAVFVASGGHRLVMGALLGTFRTLPLGHAIVSKPLVDAISTLFGESIEFGVRTAAPVATALLLSTLVLGLIGRTLPQLNILAVGFGLNTLISLSTLALSLGAIAMIFETQVELSLDRVLEAMHVGVTENVP